MVLTMTEHIDWNYNHPTEPRKIGYNFGDDDFCSYGERRDKP